MNERTIKRAQFLIDVAYVALVAFLIFLALKYVTGWILPFIIAFCIVSIVHPLIVRIVKLLNVKRSIISVIIVALVYALVGTLLFLLVFQIIFTVRGGLARLPAYYDASIKPMILSLSVSFSDFIRDLPEAWQVQAASMQRDLISTIQTSLINISQKGISWLSGLTAGIPTFMITMLFTIMLSFFISIQYEKILAFFSTQLPPRWVKGINETRVTISETVLKYIRAALTIMSVTFLELSVGMLILGQKNAIAIALGTAMLDALPFFGTGAVLIPWTIIELIQGNYPFAAGLAMLYLIVLVVRNIIEPKIVGDKLGLNPIVSLVAIYLGFKLIGVLGMILMPITTQIILSLHRKGSIKLFRDKIESDEENTKQQ